MNGAGEVPGRKEGGCGAETQSTASVDDCVDAHVDEVSRALCFFSFISFCPLT